MSTVVDKAANFSAAPVTYGEGGRMPRGDDARARPDYTCDQDYARYSPTDHDTYRRLMARQLAQIGRYACSEFVDAVRLLGAAHRIPRLDEINERLSKATG
jgi:phenylalanine-4-hydroxylase